MELQRERQRKEVERNFSVRVFKMLCILSKMKNKYTNNNNNSNSDNNN